MSKMFSSPKATPPAPAAAPPPAPTRTDAEVEAAAADYRRARKGKGGLASTILAGNTTDPLGVTTATTTLLGQ